MLQDASSTLGVVLLLDGDLIDAEVAIEIPFYLVLTSRDRDAE